MPLERHFRGSNGGLKTTSLLVEPEAIVESGTSEWDWLPKLLSRSGRSFGIAQSASNRCSLQQDQVTVRILELALLKP